MFRFTEIAPGVHPLSLIFNDIFNVKLVEMFQQYGPIKGLVLSVLGFFVYGFIIYAVVSGVLMTSIIVFSLLYLLEEDLSFDRNALVGMISTCIALLIFSLLYSYFVT
jgi:hypothetical protein